MSNKKTSNKPGSARLCFGPDRRLKKTAEFDRVYSERESTADSRLIVYACATKSRRSRIGVSVGKRLGSAVIRNRYKRTLREAFRELQHELPAGYDYVLIPRPAIKVSSSLYAKSLQQLCYKLHRRWGKRQSRNNK